MQSCSFYSIISMSWIHFQQKTVRQSFIKHDMSCLTEAVMVNGYLYSLSLSSPSGIFLSAWMSKRTFNNLDRLALDRICQIDIFFNIPSA